MAQENLYKVYKGLDTGKPYYQVLPGTNTPTGMSEASLAEAQQWASSGQANPSALEEWNWQVRNRPVGQIATVSGVQNPLNPRETLQNIEPSRLTAIQTEADKIKSGEMVQIGASPTGTLLYAPRGTPTPQQSNAVFQATQPKPTFQEYKQGFQAATAAGQTAPTDYSGAVSMYNQYLPSTQTSSAIDNFVTQDPYLNSVIGSYQQYMSQQNQRTSLVDTYKSMLESSGIQGIDTELINMKKVIEGTEDDIRTEVTKAGGFATDSQVIALSNARNKQLVKNYNTLLETRAAKERYLDTMMNLTQQDRQEADRLFDTKMNFEFKIAEMNQQMKKNAVDTLDRVAKTLGWDGVYQATSGNPQMIAQIERIYGLPSGSLAIAAQRDRDARTISEQERLLGLREKKLGIQLKQAQIEGLPLEQQLKLEQIKTEQAQRAKIVADIQKIINDQKGSILDPNTFEGKKQLANMKSQVDLISGLITDKNLSGAVGTIGLGRFAPIQSLTGGKANFIAGVEQLRSGLNLQALIDAKAKGATFGALSDQELQVLANAATKIGVWTVKDKNGNVKGYKANENDFKTELDKINNFAKLDYIYRGGNPADVGVQIIDGKYYTKNSDGSITEL
jgi:hypothetical protein